MVSRFLVGAFHEKRVNYSHGFPSVFFFDTPEVTKIVLPKILQNFKVSPKSTWWPKKLNEPKRIFLFFPRNIQHRARLKGPNLQFFWSFATEWMLKNSKRSPFQFFRHCETFLKKLSKCPQFTNTLALSSPSAIFELMIWRRLGPVPACSISS